MPEKRRQLLVKSLGGRSEALRAEVRVELSPPFTVLVGRNAAGKSAFFKLVTDAAHSAIWTHVRRDAFTFSMEFSVADSEYTYACALSHDDDEPRWEETCLQADGTDVWTLTAGRLAVEGKLAFGLPERMSPLALESSSFEQIRSSASPELIQALDLMGDIRDLFERVSLVGPGLPRSGDARGTSVQVKGGEIVRRRPRSRDRMQSLVEWLVEQKINDPAALERIRDAMHRVGVCKKLTFREFTANSENDDDLDPEDPPSINKIFSVRLDGLDFEYVSDGTARVLELLIGLHRAAAGDLVLFEEPETGIHPGLLENVVNEFEAFGVALQLMISTHSPVVVDAATVDQLRFVKRNGVTTISSLSPEHKKSVCAFLENEGTLAEYVLDDDFTEVE